MAIDDFGNCVANGIGTTEDYIASSIRQVSVDSWHQFITWYHGLSDADRPLFLALLGIGATIGTVIMTKLLGAIFGAAGAEIAAALLGLAVGFPIGVVLEVMITCEPQLDV